jgi:hypothetical protein
LCADKASIFFEASSEGFNEASEKNNCSFDKENRGFEFQYGTSVERIRVGDVAQPR